MQSGRVGLAFWIGYIVFMCFYFYFDTIDQYRNSEKVEGRVVDKLWGQSRGRRGMYQYPQIAFEYNDSVYLFGHSNGLFVGLYDKGDKATVIFPKGEPDFAEVYSFLPYWVSLTKLFFSFMISIFVFMMTKYLDSYLDFISRKNVR